MASLPFTLALLVSLALRVPAHGDLDKQIAELSLELEQTPNAVSLIVDRAELHRLHQDVGACRKDIQHAMKLNPQHDRLALVHARLELDTHHAERALPLVDRLLARESCQGELRMFALHQRAMVLTELNKTNLAISAWSALLVNHPRPQPDWYLQRASLQEAEAALHSLEEGIREIGPAVSLVLRASEMEEALGKTLAASHRIQNLVDASPRKETWLVRQADIFKRGGFLEQAKEKYQLAGEALASLSSQRRKAFSMQRLQEHIAQSLKELQS